MEAALSDVVVIDLSRVLAGPLGSPVADVSAGLYACMSILAALHVREKTGRGQHIDISLLEAAVSLLSNVSSNYLISGEEAERYGNGHPNIVPYQAFHTQEAILLFHVAMTSSTRLSVACWDERI